MMWYRAAKISDVPLGSGVVSDVAGHSLAVFNMGGEFYVVGNRCPHRGGPLGEGDLEGPIVTCPWHGWQFDITKGCHLENAKVKIPVYPVKVEGEDVMVEVK